MQSVFQFGHAHLWKNREIYSWAKFIHQKKLKRLSKLWSVTCFFFQLTFSIKKQTIFFWSIINMWFHIIGSYTSQKKLITVIGLIVQNILTKIKLYSGLKATWQLIYTWFIFWAFRKTGKTGKKYLKQSGIHRKYFKVSNSTFSIW